jgi:hypothetical protein
LMNYPVKVHPLYECYCGGWRDGDTAGNDINVTTQVDERNKLIVIRRVLLQEKDGYLQNRTRVERGFYSSYTYYDPKGEEEELLDICLELAHDYNASGYRSLSQTMMMTISILAVGLFREISIRPQVVKQFSLERYLIVCLLIET